MNKNKHTLLHHTTLLLTITIAMLIIILQTTIHAHALLATQPPQNTLWQTWDLGALIYSVSWSQDGTRIAVGGGFGKVIVFDANNGNLLWQSSDLGGIVYSVAWSPSGDKLAVGGDFNKIIVFDSSGNLLWESGDLGGWVRSVAWSPDGTKLAVGTGTISTSGSVYVYDTNGNQIWSYGGFEDPVFGVAWNENLGLLAVWGRFGQVYVFGFGGFGFLVLGNPNGYGVGLELVDNNSGGVLDLSLGAGETRVLYALGEIKVTLVSADNTSIIGPPINYSMIVSGGEVKNLTIPNLNQLLAKITFVNPVSFSVRVVVYWDNGSQEYNIAPREDFVLYTVPGNYRIMVMRSDFLGVFYKGLVLDVSVGSGDVVEVDAGRISYSRVFMLLL